MTLQELETRAKENKQKEIKNFLMFFILVTMKEFILILMET